MTQEELSILQEQKIQTTPLCIHSEKDANKLSELEMERYNYMGAMADLQHLVEQVMQHIKEITSRAQLEDYIKRNYKKQWERFMTQDTHTLVIGEFYKHKTVDEWGELIAIRGDKAALYNAEVEKFFFRDVDVLEKYIPEKKHTIEFWVNVYDTDGYVFTGGCNTTEDDANYENPSSNRIGCLHFTRAFTEGEGL